MTAETSTLNIVCPHCDAVNRVPVARLKEAPVCGQCKKGLLNSEPLAVTVDNFERHIGRNDIPVVVDFWAPWCGPCKMMGPNFAQVAQLMPELRFLKVNTQNEPTLAQRFNIRSIPTLALFVGGREMVRQAGALDAASLQRWISQALRT